MTISINPKHHRGWQSASNADIQLWWCIMDGTLIMFTFRHIPWSCVFPVCVHTNNEGNFHGILISVSAHTHYFGCALGVVIKILSHCASVLQQHINLEYVILEPITKYIDDSTPRWCSCIIITSQLNERLKLKFFWMETDKFLATFIHRQGKKDNDEHTFACLCFVEDAKHTCRQIFKCFCCL